MYTNKTRLRGRDYKKVTFYKLRESHAIIIVFYLVLCCCYLLLWLKILNYNDIIFKDDVIYQSAFRPFRVWFIFLEVVKSFWCTYKENSYSLIKKLKNINVLIFFKLTKAFNIWSSRKLFYEPFVLKLKDFSILKP